MKSLRIWKLRWAFVVGTLWVSAGLAWATTAACPTSGTVFSSVSGSGCEAVNLNFTNLAMGGQSQGSPAPVAPTANNTDIATSGTVADLPISLQFTGPTSGSGCGVGNTLWCINTGGSQGVCAPPNQTQQCYTPSSSGLQSTFTTTIDPAQSPAPPGEHYAITSVTLNVGNPIMTGGFDKPNSGNNIGAGGSELAARAFLCLGGPLFGTCTGPTTEIEFEIDNLGPANGGIQTLAFACDTLACSSGVPGLTYSIATPGVTQIGLEVQMFGDWVSSGLVSLDSFGVTFGEQLETPEPSTAQLFSGMLLAGGLAALRKRYRFRA